MANKIEDYLHLYLAAPVRIFNTVTQQFSSWRKMSISDLNLIVTHGHKFEIQLRPLNDITEEDFYSWGKQEYDDEIVVKATFNRMWVWGLYDKREYNERIENEMSVDPIDLIAELEEADYDNVISCTKDGSIAYGTDDEMRFFIGVQEIASWHNHLRKRQVDIDGLINAGLAINIK